MFDEDDGLTEDERLRMADIEAEEEERVVRRRKLSELQRQNECLAGRVRRIEEENRALRARCERLERLLAARRPVIIVKPVSV